LTTDIKDRLVRKGLELFNSPAELVDFTGNDAADLLLNDFDNHPHAYVLACIMDRQIKAEKAWMIPYLISKKTCSFDFEFLLGLSQEEIHKLMTEPTPLHRFPKEMSLNFYKAIELINNKYQGNAANIWNDIPSSAVIVNRFLEFRGVGQKIATMAANILVRHFKIKLKDYVCIDISVDIHVIRVFERLGFVAKNATTDQIVLTAKSLHPEFPGLMDFPAWEIGRKWCRPTNPICNDCYLNDICLKVI
jgi:endonuclease III